MSPENKRLIFIILVSDGYTLALLLKCNFYYTTKSIKKIKDNKQIVKVIIFNIYFITNNYLLYL